MTGTTDSLEQGAPRATRRVLVNAEWTLLALGLAAMAWAPKGIQGDAGARFDALSRLLTRGELVDMKYSIVGPLFATPLWLLGKVVGSPAAWCDYYGWVLLAAGLVAFYRLFDGIFDADTRRRFLLLLVFASMLAFYHLWFLGEMFTVVMLGIGVAAVASDRSRWGWPLAVLGAVNTPPALVPLALVALAHAWVTRRWRHLLALPAAALMILGERLLKHGQPFVSGYENDHGFQTALPYSGLPGFSYPLLLGLIVLSFSFGKGLVFFASGLLVARPRGEGLGRRIQLYWLVATAGLLLVYAQWWAWYGGWSFGPRFLAFAALPSSLALALALGRRSAPPAARGVVLLLLAWSFWVGFTALVIRLQDLARICQTNRYALESLCWYAPELSPLIHPFSSPPTFDLVGGMTAFVWLAALAVLSLPLLAPLVGETRALAIRQLSRLKELRTWRF